MTALLLEPEHTPTVRDFAGRSVASCPCGWQSPPYFYPGNAAASARQHAEAAR